MQDNSTPTPEPKREPIVGGQQPGRNEPCPCGSGLKYKHCHGNQKKLELTQRFAAAFFNNLIHDERMKHGLEPWPFTCNSCGKGFRRPKMAERAIITPGTDGETFVPACPHCGSTNITKNESPKPEAEPKIVGGSDIE